MKRYLKSLFALCLVVPVALVMVACGDKKKDDDGKFTTSSMNDYNNYLEGVTQQKWAGVKVTAADKEYDLEGVEVDSRAVSRILTSVGFYEKETWDGIDGSGVQASYGIFESGKSYEYWASDEDESTYVGPFTHWDDAAHDTVAATFDLVYGSLVQYIPAEDEMDEMPEGAVMTITKGTEGDYTIFKSVTTFSVNYPERGEEPAFTENYTMKNVIYFKTDTKQLAKIETEQTQISTIYGKYVSKSTITPFTGSIELDDFFAGYQDWE
jgi:hypothetical protein